MWSNDTVCFSSLAQILRPDVRHEILKMSVQGHSHLLINNLKYKNIIYEIFKSYNFFSPDVRLYFSSEFQLGMGAEY